MSQKRQDLALGGWVALSLAMLVGAAPARLVAQVQGAEQTAEQPEPSAQAGEEAADEEMPSLQIDPNASPEEVQAQIEAHMKARREAIRRQLAGDPAWKPAFVESHVIRVGGESEPVRVHNFCLDFRGNLLVCCGGDRLDLIEEDGELKAKMISESAEIRVFSSDGKRVASWPLEFTPQAVAVHRDGTVFVGGGGRIARLDPRGRVIATVSRPDIPEEQPEAEPPAQEGIPEEEYPAEKVASSDTAEDKPEEEPAESTESEAEKEEPAEEGGLLAVLGAVVSTLFGDEEGEEEAEPGMSEATQEAMRRYMARQAREVSGIAVTDQDLFVACPTGTGYAVWRMGHDLSQPEKIVDRLRGCCGQMDIAAYEGCLYVAENSRKRVLCYDREGKELSKFGQGDRTQASGFGSCCNPMNLCFGPGGEVITSESGPPDAVKRFGRDGEFLGVIALPEMEGGCVRVQVAMSPDGNQVFVLNTGRGEIHVFADPRFLPTHQEVATIAIPMGQQTAAIHSFCLDGAGRLLAACGGERMVYTRTPQGAMIETINEPSGIRVIRPDGELADTWSLEITPQAVNVGPDGTVFCGGQGRVAKLSAEGEVLLVADSPQVAELGPLPPLEPQAEEEPADEDEEGKKAREEEKRAKIGALNEQITAIRKEVMELYAQVRAKEDDDQAKAQLEAEFEKAMLEYSRVSQEMRDLTVDPKVLAAQRRSTALRKRAVTGIAVTKQDVFVACPSSQGSGYDVWRTDHDFRNPRKIVTRLRGCCGQMDIQAADGKLYAAENARTRVVAYDRDGNELGAWGKGDRTGVVGFGSCCNPMNIRFGPGGEVYTSEASVGRIKRFSPDGEFLGLVGNVTIVPGCKHVPIGISADGDRVYLLDITRTHIVVLQRRRASQGETPETNKTAGLRSSLE